MKCSKILNLQYVFLILMGLMPLLKISAKIISYPYPKEMKTSSVYVVEINGKYIPVYDVQTQHHDKKYYMAYFDMVGSVNVKIKTNISLRNLKVLPSRYNIKPSVIEDEADFTLDKPCDISFEPNGCNSPLILFANNIEKNIPSKKESNVIYFGPGVHNPVGGLIKLKSNQTLYIAGGAVVNAGIEATGDNITICGSGLIDGTDWDHNAGPTDFMINAKNCNNFVMKDVILKGSYYWTIVPQNCDGVLIDHVRLVGSRVGNDDGVDPCNSSNVKIRNCFFRTDDDSVSPKGITRSGGEKDSKSVENILVENCTFWVDFANVFRIATESSCPSLLNFTAKNIDVIHFPNREQVQIFWLHPTGKMAMDNLFFENIRINGEHSYNLIKLTPDLNLVGTRPIIQPTPNNIQVGTGRRGLGSRGYGEFVVIPSNGPYIHNVIFHNVCTYNPYTELNNERGLVILKGVDAQHNVSNITFNNVSYFGKELKANSKNIIENEFVSNIQFIEK